MSNVIEYDEPRTFAHEVWYDRLKFCGCGNPEIVLARMRDTLRAIKSRSDLWCGAGTSRNEDDRICKAVDVASGPDDASQLMTMYILDAAGLCEHGGSVYGQWLTEDGGKLLAELESLPEEKWLD